MPRLPRRGERSVIIPYIAHQLLDSRAIESSHARQVEILERDTEVVALAQDGDPAQASLKPFETQFFKQAPVVGHWPPRPWWKIWQP